MFYPFAGVTSFTSDLKLCNFITLWETPQNFVQGSFSIESLKLYHKNSGGCLGSGPL